MIAEEESFAGHILVVIPASGKGVRCKYSPPKQFQLLNNRPLLSYTISAFERLSCVKAIIVTTPAAESLISKTKNIITTWNHCKVKLIQGGKTRHRSIFLGLKCLKELCCMPQSIVIIHDGVRPFVEQRVIIDIANAAAKYHAAGIVRPSVSTIISMDGDGFLDSVLDRTLYFASEMPQAFTFDTICRAYEKASENDFEQGTECLKIVADYTGVKAKLLRGNEDLWKVTYSRDVWTAQHVLSLQTCKNTTLILVSKVCSCKFPEIIRGQWTQFSLETRACSELEEDFHINPSTNYIFMFNDEVTIFPRLSHCFKSIAKRKFKSREPLYQSLILVYCWHSEDTSIFLKVRDFARNHGKDLLQSNVLLYAIVMQDECHANACTKCAMKLISEAHVDFAGQTFFF